MKKLIVIAISAIMLLTLMPAVALAHPEGIDGTVVELQNGQHYNLNIIGVKNPKKADMDYDLDGNGGGGVIFVDMYGKNKINLIMGEDYAVFDKNATDGDGALLQLPDPDLDPYVVGQDKTGVDTESAYSVFVRPLGKPGGWTKITTCADVVESNLLAFLGKDEVNILNEAAELGGVASVESVGQLITERPKGKSKFTNVTAQLLTIVLKVEIIVDGEVVETIYVRVPIFDDILENEYWEYDNHGLKLLQVRFYPVGTDVSLADAGLPPL